MMVADVLGPWHDIETVDGDGNPYRDQRRRPQVTHDISDMDWTDVTAQLAERIPPSPGLCVWRVWCTEAQLEAMVAHAAYEVLRSADVDAPFAEPDDWPAVEPPGDCDDAFPPLPDSGWLEAGAIYQHGEQAVIVRQGHDRTEHDPGDVLALFLVYRADAADELPWVAGEQVYVGTRRTYEGTTYEAIINHVTQSDYTPDVTPTLWKVVQEGVAPWVQPTGAHDAYQKGDRVTYNGKTWESTIDANVWAPGVYGWIEVDA